MALKAEFYKHTLNFNFDAGTSRGVLKNKDSYFIKIYDSQLPEIFGLGEAGPLYGLSPDFGIKAESILKQVVEDINRGHFKWHLEDYKAFPSIVFALETAHQDLLHGGKRQIFDNDFYAQNIEIPINGLVWMGTREFMKSQILKKIKQNFKTIKLKIGAINFDEELSLLKYIRSEFHEENITLRVDANGAFSSENALEKLKQLSDFDLHSIEQPIAQGQEDEMAKLCEISPVKIALDEELINNYNRKEELLRIIKPAFIILKPSLIGGFTGSREWINIADSLGIQWWVTSALESNVGLNAICQFTANYMNSLPQGLGTGKLYSNNFNSPLQIENGYIKYGSDEWKLSYFI